MLRVLHVDDEVDFLKVAKACLEMEGPFQVDTAVSVQEAFEKLKEKVFEVIVSNERVRADSGLDFLKELREQKIDTPFIVFSGKGRGKGTIDALSCDGVQYIDKFSKPEIVYKELSRSIRESAGKKDRKPRKATHASARNHRVR